MAERRSSEAAKDSLVNPSPVLEVEQDSQDTSSAIIYTPPLGLLPQDTISPYSRVLLDTEQTQKHNNTRLLRITLHGAYTTNKPQPAAANNPEESFICFPVTQNEDHMCMPVVITCVTEESLPLAMRHTALNQSPKHCLVVIASTESLISFTHASVVVCIHLPVTRGQYTLPVFTGCRHGQ